MWCALAAGVQIRTIDRVCEIPHEGPFCDLMWSDPEDIETWAVSPRGAGWLFGRKVTSEFNQINGERPARCTGVAACCNAHACLSFPNRLAARRPLWGRWPLPAERVLRRRAHVALGL